jgi:hypothetical protein
VAQESRPGGYVRVRPLQPRRGSIIVAFHNVWTGTAAVVTAFGWGLVLYKRLFTLLVPQVSLRGLERKRLSPERAWLIVLVGV